MMSSERQKSKATWVVVIIAVLVVIAFLAYYFRDRLPVYSPAITNTPAVSDAVSSIDKDLKATDLNNLDKESADINKELAAPATQ